MGYTLLFTSIKGNMIPPWCHTYSLFRFVKTSNSVVLDYHVSIIPLENADRILSYGELGNFSVAGFEMVLERHLSHYLITYYLPSGRYQQYHLSHKITRSNWILQDCSWLCPGSASWWVSNSLIYLLLKLSLKVPPDIIPGRMALLVTLFLVLVNIFNNITTNTPKAEGEVWRGWWSK